jgi:hypothetical protein
MILVNIDRYRGVHGHAEQSRIGKRNREDAKNPQRPQQVQNPCRIPRQDVSHGFQRKFSLRENPFPIHTAETFRANSPLSPLFTHTLPLGDHCTIFDAHLITP